MHFFFQFFPLNDNFLFVIFYEKLILTFSLGNQSFGIIRFFEGWLGFSIHAFCLLYVCLSVSLSVCCQSLNHWFYFWRYFGASIWQIMVIPEKIAKFGGDTKMVIQEVFKINGDTNFGDTREVFKNLVIPGMVILSRW